MHGGDMRIARMGEGYWRGADRKPAIFIEEN